MLDIFHHQSVLIDITLDQLSDKVIDFLENVPTRSFFLPLSFLLANLKLDTLIWQGLHTSPTLLLL